MLFPTPLGPTNLPCLDSAYFYSRLYEYLHNTLGLGLGRQDTIRKTNSRSPSPAPSCESSSSETNGATYIVEDCPSKEAEVDDNILSDAIEELMRTRDIHEQTLKRQHASIYQLQLTLNEVLATMQRLEQMQRTLGQAQAHAPIQDSSTVSQPASATSWAAVAISKG